MSTIALSLRTCVGRPADLELHGRGRSCPRLGGSALLGGALIVRDNFAAQLHGPSPRKLNRIFGLLAVARRRKRPTRVPCDSCWIVSWTSSGQLVCVSHNAFVQTPPLKNYIGRVSNTVALSRLCLKSLAIPPCPRVASPSACHTPRARGDCGGIWLPPQAWPCPVPPAGGPAGPPGLAPPFCADSGRHLGW